MTDTNNTSNVSAPSTINSDTLSTQNISVDNRNNRNPIIPRAPLTPTVKNTGSISLVLPNIARPSTTPVNLQRSSGPSNNITIPIGLNNRSTTSPVNIPKPSPPTLPIESTSVQNVNISVANQLNTVNTQPTLEPIIKPSDVIPLHTRPASPRDRTEITINGLPINRDVIIPIQIDTIEPPSEIIRPSSPVVSINIPRSVTLPSLTPIESKSDTSLIINPAPPSVSLNNPSDLPMIPKQSTNISTRSNETSNSLSNNTGARQPIPISHPNNIDIRQSMPTSTSNNHIILPNNTIGNQSNNHPENQITAPSGRQTTPITQRNNDIRQPIPVSHPNNQPISHPNNQPISHPNNQPISHPNNQPVSHPNNQPVSHPNNQPISHPNAGGIRQPIPVSHPNNQPVSQPNAGGIRQPIPISHPNNQSVPHSNNQSVPHSNNQFGSHPNNQLGSHPNNQSVPHPNNQPGSHPNNQLGSHSNTSGIRQPIPISQSNNQLGSQSNNQLGSQSNNQPGSQSNNQLGSQSNNQPGSQSNNQPGSQSNNGGIRQPIPISQANNNGGIRQPIPIAQANNGGVRQPIPISQPNNSGGNYAQNGIDFKSPNNENIRQQVPDVRTQDIQPVPMDQQSPTQASILPPINVPNYSLMSQEEQAQHRSVFRTRFGLLRNAWPNYYIPDISDDVPLEQIHAQYDIYVRHIHISSNVDQYKVYLVIMWLIIELFCIKIGLNIGGYTMSQMKGMNKYERLLIVLGETNYRTAGPETHVQSTWSPEIQILFMALVNAVTFILIKMLSDYIDERMATTIIEGLSSYLSGSTPQPGQILFGGPSQQQPTQTYVSGPPPGGVPMPATTNGFGGLDVASLIGNFGSMFLRGQGPLAGNAPTPAPVTTSIPQAPTTPRYRPAYTE